MDIYKTGWDLRWIGDQDWRDRQGYHDHCWVEGDDMGMER